MPDPAIPPAANADDTESQVRAFEQHRRQRQSTLAEDYCELIADLIAETGEARATDIARRFGVSHATVVNSIGRLQKAGFVSSQPYRSIFLTEIGRDLAARSKRRHVIVLRLLEALGVDAETARADAEGIEHHVSDATLAAFERFLTAREAQDKVASASGLKGSSSS
ncbi:MAG: manganese-binding transcriptional regulator MntR [Aliidongia sp.]